MILDSGIFLEDLASWLCTQLSLSNTSTQRAIWPGLAIDAVSTPVYTTLALYAGGAIDKHGQGTLPVQVWTRGLVVADVRTRAQQIWAKFVDGQGRPARMLDVTVSGRTHRIIGSDITPARWAPLDETQRHQRFFDLDLRVVRTA